jgi:DNA-directed RNA polymerase subunit RPC12/RpoP
MPAATSAPSAAASSSSSSAPVGAAQPLLYRCMACKEEMPLQESGTPLCHCGWRIFTKTRRQAVRSYSTD